MKAIYFLLILLFGLSATLRKHKFTIYQEPELTTLLNGISSALPG